MPKLNVDWAELQSCWEEVRDSGSFTEGKYVRLFEEAVSQWSGLHAVAFNSAGSGLYAMMRLAGDTFSVERSVAVQNNTFYATGAMPKEAGWKVRLTDVGEADLSMSLTDLKPLLRPLGAVILTHVGGSLAVDYRAISEFCRENGLLFFEDAAHALGVGGNGALCAGQLSDGAVFSLYPTKAVPAGEGGVVVTRHHQFAEALREFRNYGKHVENGVIRYRGQGFNLRMDEWTAAISYLQMKRLPDLMARRAAAADQLSRVIKTRQVFGEPGTSNWYKYIVDAAEARELGIRRYTGKVYQASDQLLSALETGPAYAHYLRDKNISRFPVSDKIAVEHACIPVDEDMYEGMSPSAILDWLRS